MEHYGLANVWQQGDFVTRSILIALILMSLLSWTVVLLKFWNVVRIKRVTRDTERSFWHSDNFEAGLQKLVGNSASYAGNPLLALALSGKEAAEHHHQTQPHLHDRMDISDWVTRCLKDTMDEIVTRLQAGLAILASIGSTAPFVGLFGTVWGIYHALISIGASGQTSIDHVAGPVGESLIMTAFGLFVAIPAVLGYNALTRANKGIVSKLHRFAHGLHAYSVTGARPSSQTGRSELRLAATSTAAVEAGNGTAKWQ
ncbi:transporter, MotA/TolQ/ExbB proton channel family protein [Caballeronia sordidicola]|uniref:Biopolymer transport protein ExbB n=1 Tax=Caballeronia sordidicola TaxID=196367 RepID=A0A158HMM5_CABSO|nr:MotA/TolQ/ExbB proton channel family protein [Caballeronia sordidicola]SAL45337.1 transporter, MotA/TolQ/ExbB proton channel family protein [Caballeronia sordidicola]